MPRRTLWMILAAVVISLACYERADHNPYGRWFAEVMETIDRNYLEPVDEQKLFEGAITGMMGRLDNYSAFYPRTEAPGFEESLDQEYGGIGIELNPELPTVVLTPIVGSPAHKAGMLPGDKIVAVEGQSTANMQIRDLVRLLRGKPGTEVAITVQRPGRSSPLDVRLERAKIHTDSVLGDSRFPDGSWNFFLPGDKRIGYVRVVAFGKTTLAELTAALGWLSERNCRGVILDLRNNPGGLLQAGEQVCDLFMPKGTLIVSTRGRDAVEHDRYKATGLGPYQNLPLVVLVNDKSASASEIVAACLQDHHRATIVGQRTWGKGTVQSVIPLEGGRSLLKLTIASYWRPSGKNIHRTSTSQDSDEWGVKPDAGCEVKLDDKQLAQLMQEARKFDRVPSSSGSPAVVSTPALPDVTSRLQIDRPLERALEVMREKLSPVAAKANAG